MDTKVYYVLVDKFGHYAHRYHDNDLVIKTTRHFCDARHSISDKLFLPKGFRFVKVTSTFEEVV